MATIEQGMPVNEATAKPVHTRSRFPLGYHLYNTLRFGEISPHFVAEGVPGDKMNLRCAHDIRSFTLGAPLMQNIEMRKDYFMVPMEAILPMNWDKFYTNPPVGDDCPPDVGPATKGFYNYCRTLNELLQSLLKSVELRDNRYADPSATGDIQNFLDRLWVTHLFKMLLVGELIYSPGALISSLGGRFSNMFDFFIKDDPSSVSPQPSGTWKRFDAMFDLWIKSLAKHCNSISYRPDPVNNPYLVKLLILDRTGLVGHSADDQRNYVTIHEALEEMRDNLMFDITAVNMKSGSTATQVIGLDGAWDFTNTNHYWNSYPANTDYVNLSRLWAYQIVCAHYYTNDKIDYIYSAELYRQYVGNLLDISTSIGWSNEYKNDFFTMNGINHRYDNLSSHFFDVMCSKMYGWVPNITTYDDSGNYNWNDIVSQFTNNGTSPTSNQYVAMVDGTKNNMYTALYAFNTALAYFQAVLGYKHSLRFLDYFSGSKTRPLAIGNVSVDTSGLSVSVVDITRNIQYQRFFNAVNRIGRQVSEYVKGLTGVSQAPDYHNPFYLAHTTDVIYGTEVENTGNAQLTDRNSVTTVLRSNAGKSAFSIDIDRECIVIGVTYFDIARSYVSSAERQWFHQNRFDMFNPYMQFIGDQAVYASEINGIGVSLVPWGYQLRHMEYKQRFNQAAGGFVQDLPGYAFVGDADYERIQGNRKLSPSFIRSKNYELDKFYVSLDGVTLSTYYHFIVDSNNDCEASRPMAFAPSIL